MKAETSQDQRDVAGAPGTRGSNQSGMRAHNERLVLSLVRRNGPMAKADIARATGLSAQTVSVIMRALEEDGLLDRCDPVRGKVGQPLVPMRLAPEGAFFLGLKVGRRSVELVLTDFLGGVRGRMHRTHAFPTPDGTIRFTLEGIAALSARLTPAQRGRIAGLGIAIPFQLWDWARSIGVPPEEMAAWRDRDVAAEIAGRIEVPVFLQNDATSACGAELVFGTGDAPQDFLYFYVGYFIGGGLVLNGSLYTGRTGNAGALGSLPVPAPHGGSRQLLDVASLCVLESALAGRGLQTETLWTDPHHWDLPADLLETWIEGAARGMAAAIAAAAAIVDVEAVLIDGWIPAALRTALVARTSRALGGINLAGITPPELREGTIGPDARALGAASLPLSERFLVDRNAILKPL